MFYIDFMQAIIEWHSNLFYYCFGFDLLKFKTLWFLRTKYLFPLSCYLFFCRKFFAFNILNGFFFDSVVSCRRFIICLFYHFCFQIETWLIKTFFLFFEKFKHTFLRSLACRNLLFRFLFTIFLSHYKGGYLQILNLLFENLFHLSILLCEILKIYLLLRAYDLVFIYEFFTIIEFFWALTIKFFRRYV